MPAVIAAIGMLWAKRQGKGKFRAYHDLVFERFWRRELDIEDAEAIAAVLSEVHADRTGFRSYLAGAGRIEHDRSASPQKPPAYSACPALLSTVNSFGDVST